MSLLFSNIESRAITRDSFGLGAGEVLVDPLRLIPFYAATTGIADDVAVTPWAGYRSGPDGVGVKMSPKPPLLDDPGIGLDFIPWMSQALMSALMHGFAFGLIVTRKAGWPHKVAWVKPSKVHIDEAGRIPVFSVNGKVVLPGDYIYVPGPTVPGSIRGLSPVALFRLQLGKSKLAQKYASEFFDRGIMPPGVLKNTARTLDGGAVQVAKDRFKAAVSGRDIFVTGSDWDWTALSIPNDDAVFLETIKASATEIAAIFRVAPEDIGGETGSSMTYSTVELNELKRQRRALLPWVRRFEEAFTRVSPRPQYVKANLDALVRVDLTARTNALVARLKAGIDTLPEVRVLEDKAPLTPEQKAEWQSMYGPRAGQPTSTAAEGAPA